jgi:hypothetical protein
MLEHSFRIKCRFLVNGGSSTARALLDFGELPFVANKCDSLSCFLSLYISCSYSLSASVRECQ